MAPNINFGALQQFVSADTEDVGIEEIHGWFDKLVEYEPEGSESTAQLGLLFSAMKASATFFFTAAEELRDVAEKEAALAADREAQLQEQLNSNKEELELLRERITDKAHHGDSSETFRAQINSLREENRQLQQASRERDRELADQRDRFESVLARAEGLHRERESLLYNCAQLEQTNKELDRRLRAKSDEAEHEWEMRKLRQRNEQAVTLSQQLQTAVSQNDSLREEVTRLSAALEEATRLMASTSERYDDMKNRLAASGQRIEELEIDRERLEETLARLRETSEADAQQQASEGGRTEEKESDNQDQFLTLKKDITVLTQELADERARVASLKSRLEWAEARAERNEEREAHLERMRQELQNATREAKELLGYTPVHEDNRRADSTIAEEDGIRRALLQSQHTLQITYSQLQQAREDYSRFEADCEEKDKHIMRITEELIRLRDTKLGSAVEIVEDMRAQIRIRDEQIERLNQTCTLLHVELGRLAEEESRHLPDEATIRVGKSPAEIPADSGTAASPFPKPSHPDVVPVPRTTAKPAPTSSQDKETTTSERPREDAGSEQPPFGTWKEQALLVARLYGECAHMLKELEMKDEILRDSEHTLRITAKAFEANKEQLKLAYNEIQKLKSESLLLPDEQPLEPDLNRERLIELEELRVLADSIRAGGSELDRRATEQARKLIAERIARSRAERRVAAARQRLTAAERRNTMLRDMALASHSDAELEAARLKRQLDDTWAEEARLQRLLLDSVPRSMFTQLNEKYVRLLRSTTELGAEDNSTVDDAAIIPDIIPKREHEESAILLKSELEHTKRLVSVMEEQATFWKTEADTFSLENTEMKRLLELCENESDSSAILASLERHLFNTIREQAEAVRKGTRATEQLRHLKAETEKQREQWAGERRHLLSVARLLHSTLQRTQTETIRGITVSQVEVFRGRIERLMTNEEAVKDDMEKVAKARSEAEDALRRARALEQMRDIVANNTDRASLERIIHTLVSEQMLLKKQVEKTTSEAEEAQATLRRLRETSAAHDDDRREVLERIGGMLQLSAAAAASAHPSRNGRLHEQQRHLSSTIDSGEPIKVTPEQVPPSTDLVVEEDEEETENSDSEESEIMDSPKKAQRVIVKTVIHDNTSKYEERLQQMRETADICIRSYKDQLDEKERALNTLRSLLEKKSNEVQVINKVETVKEIVKVVDEEKEQELGRLRQNVITLETRIFELEEANSVLYEQSRAEPPSVPTKEAFVQTNFDEASRQPTEMGDDSFVMEEELVRGGSRRSRDELSTSGGRKTPPAHLQPSPALQAERDARLQIEEQSKAAQAQFDLERRSYRTTIAKLTRANKELSRAIEEIKATALTEIANRATLVSQRPGVNEEELQRTKDENDALRRTIERQKKTIDGIREELASGQKNEINKKEEIARWHEKKKMEENIERLRKTLRESGIKEKEAVDLAARREKRIVELETLDSTRQAAIAQLQTQLRKAQRTAASNESKASESSALSSKIRLLEEQLISSRIELGESRIRMMRLQEERVRLKEAAASAAAHEKSAREREERRARQESETAVKDNGSKQQIAEITARLNQAQTKYTSIRERLVIVEKEYAERVKRDAMVIERLQRESTEIGAIAVLKDKLQAKELEIRQLKIRTSELEGRLDQR